MESDEYSEEKDSDGEEDHGPSYSLDDAIEHLGFGRFHVQLVLLAGLATIADTIEIMMVAILAPELKCEWSLSALQTAFIPATMFGANGVGTILWGVLADNFGRKRILIVSLLVSLVFNVCSSFATSYAAMLVLRMAASLGTAGYYQTLTIVTETTPLKLRGRCGVALFLFWSLGGVLTALLGLTIAPLNWRYFIVISCIPTALFLCLSWFLPESVRFLVTSGKHERATEQLKQIAKINNSSLPEGTFEMSTTVNEARGSLRNLFLPEWRKLSLILLPLWMFGIFNYFGVSLFTTEIMQNNMDGCNTHASAAIANTTCKRLTNKDYHDLAVTASSELPGVLIALLLVEFVGRRHTAAMMLVLSTLSYALLAVCVPHMVTIGLLFCIRGFLMGATVIVEVYTSEMYATDIRSTALGFFIGVARLASCASSFLALMVTDTSYYLPVAVFAGTTLLSTGLTECLPVETKGRMLSDDSKRDDEKRFIGSGDSVWYKTINSSD